MEIRKVVFSDVDSIVDLRMRLFKELGETNGTDDWKELQEGTRQYLFDNLNRNLICWVSVADDKVIASASLCLFSRMPYHGNLFGKEAYVLNVYTLPEYRRQGIAAKMIKEIIEYSKVNHISEQGRNIYRKCGFTGREDCMTLYL